MKGWFILNEGQEDQKVVEYEGTEEELIQKTRKTLYTVNAGGGLEPQENEDFVASQVFWREDALESHLASLRPPNPEVVE